MIDNKSDLKLPNTEISFSTKPNLNTSSNGLNKFICSIITKSMRENNQPSLEKSRDPSPVFVKTNPKESAIILSGGYFFNLLNF